MPADAGIVVINVLICYIFQVGVVRRIRRRGMATEDQKEKAWESAKKIRGEDPDKYRQDPYGNRLYKSSYGKNSAMGWEVDHIKPKSRNGSDNSKNLQALKTEINRSKQDSLQKKSRHSKQ